MNTAGDIRCPYQGLVPFAEPDAEWFFGRSAEIRIVSANLLTARLTLLYGDSGVGKSSLLRAGVVPHLRRLAQAEAERPDRPRFRVMVVDRWQDDPIAAIVELLVATSGAETADRPIPPFEPGRFTEYLAGWTDRLGGSLLLVFDQFEEYLRYHGAEGGEASFAEEFPRAVTRLDLNVNFLLAIREDEYAQLDRFKPKLPGLYRNYLRLRHLGLAAAREAIVRPLEALERQHTEVQVPQRIEPALVDAILGDVRSGRVVLGEAGVGAVRHGEEDVQIQTPYLQLALTRVWQAEREASSAILRLATYRELGGADLIVRSHLSRALGALTQTDQALAAGVFRHLVTPSGAKVAHALADLAEYAHADLAECPSADVARLETVLDHLCRESTRILRRVAPAPGQAGIPRFEIYTDSLATPVLDWWKRFRQAQERAQAEAKLSIERRRKQIFLRLSVGLFLALLIAATLGTLAWLKMREVTVWELIHRARASLHQNPANSVRLMAEAANWMWLQPATNKLAAEQVLRAALLESHERRIPGAPPDGLLRSKHGEWVSPDAELHFRKRPNEKGVLDMQQASPRTAAPGFWERFDTLLGSEVLALEFNAEASMFAVCGAGGVRVWSRTNLGAGQSVWLPHTNTVVRAAVFVPSANDALLATGGDDATLWLWELVVGASPRIVGRHGKRINAVAVSSDNRFLATGSDDQTAAVWDIWNARPVATLRGHTNAVTRVQFSANGQSVWTSDSNGSVRCWASRVGLIVAGATPSTEIVVAARTSAGVFFVTSDPAGGIWKWNPSGTDPALELTRAGFRVTEAAFSADGEWVALAGSSNQVAVKNLKDVSQALVKLTVSNRITGLGFSGDASLLATVDRQGEALVWRWREQTHGPVLRGSAAQDGTVLFSGGTRERLIMASGNHPLVFALDRWTPSDPSLTNPVIAFTNRHEGIVKGLGLSADGRRVLSVGNAGANWVWRLADGQPVRNVRVSGALLACAFSPDGRFLLTGGEEGVAHVWDPQLEDPLLLRLPGHREPDRGDGIVRGDVCAVWFSPDGRQAFTAGRDGTIRRHDTTELVPYPACVRLARDRSSVAH